MKTTHFSGGNGVLFFFHHHHHQIAHFPYPLHLYVGGGGGGGQIPPPPPPQCTTSAVGAGYTHHHVHYICKSRKWDFIADYNIDEDDDDDEESVVSMQQMDDNLQEFIDSLWIFKVLRSYGLVLPLIILSMLITTGPKAFLLALALPLGQSTFSYAIQKMQEEQRNTNNSKPRQKKTKTKKSSYTRSSGSSDEETIIPNVKKKTRQSVDRNVNVSTEQTGKKNAASYGGWDEL